MRSVAWVLLFAIAVSCSGPPSHDDALARIQELHETDMAAARVMDIETLIDLWTEDGVLLLPDQEPIIGKAALWEHMQQQLPAMQEYEITEYVHHFDEVQVVGSWAYEWGTFEGASRPKSGGPETRERARLCRILRRQADGSWRCARVISQRISAE